MDENENIQDMLNKRNTKTVFDVVNEQNLKLLEFQGEIDGLRGALQTALKEFADLRSAVHQMRAQVAGHGSTEREQPQRVDCKARRVVE